MGRYYNQYRGFMKKGSSHDPATIEKMRQAHLGKGHTDATRQLISEINRGRKMDPDVVARVVQTRAQNKLKKHHDRTTLADDEQPCDCIPE